mmetsp:Transcript_128/g.475  ORF Transcript_128/g.475 Transcript_128/m.475 type:complete len:91 (-) Transcript_128:479-751(-)
MVSIAYQRSSGPTARTVGGDFCPREEPAVREAARPPRGPAEVDPSPAVTSLEAGGDSSDPSARRGRIKSAARIGATAGSAADPPLAAAAL